MSTVRSMKRKSAQRKVSTMNGTKVVITNEEVIPVFNALTTLGAEKFGITFSFRIKRILAKLKEPVATYQEAHKEIVDEYCRKDAEGKNLTKVARNGEIEYDLKDGWRPKMDELNALEAAEVDGISAKELSAACEEAKTTVSGNILFQLGSLVVDDLEDDDDPAVKAVRQAADEITKAVATIDAGKQKEKAA